MPPIRVLVVDDSVVVRHLVTSVLGEAPGIEVAGTAANGRLALTAVDELAPDVITMDIEMPLMNGIETVRELRRRGCRLPIIMFSTLTESGAEATLEALSAGASDYVTKPANVGSVTQSMASVRDQLVPRVRALAGRAVPRQARPSQAAPRPVLGWPFRTAQAPGTAGDGSTTGATSTTSTSGSTSLVPVAGPVAGTPRAHRGAPSPARESRTAPGLLAIGSSTGGPEALATVLRSLPADLPVPVVITQHMPPTFTRQLASRLDRSSPMTVCEAEQGQPLRPGVVHIAPGDWHLGLKRAGTEVRCDLSQGPPENFCRPAVDVMMRSAVALYGPGVLAVVLTGMGSDGRAGCGEVRRAGGQVLVQDEATSIVWGMPGAVAGAGFADAVLPLGDVAPAVVRAVSRAPRTVSAARRVVSL